MVNKAYEQAGVDINAGYAVVKKLKDLTGNQQIGSFGGAIPVPQAPGIQLVAGTDGVGTKLLVAIQANQHTTIGIDLVAMCVNDILAQGANPLFFLDYLGLAKTDPEQVGQIVSGIVKGCQIAGMQLIGGETAEMPDMYENGHYDLAGFAVGSAPTAQLLQASNVRQGDILFGLPASGIHSNGYSLVRKILFKDAQLSLTTQLPELTTDLQTELLKPTTIYAQQIVPLIKQQLVASIAHITGGGLIENVERALPKELGALIDSQSWPQLPIFEVLQKLGNINPMDMWNTFNMGIGMVLIVHPENQAMVQQIVRQSGMPIYQIGQINPRQQTAVSISGVSDD